MTTTLKVIDEVTTIKIGPALPSWMLSVRPGRQAQIYQSAGASQVIPSAAWTKVTSVLDSVDFDDENWWDAANYRFVPSSGRYRIGGLVTWVDMADQAKMVVGVRQNGTLIGLLGRGTHSSAATSEAGFSGSLFVEANGTDYFEIWVYHDKGTDASIGHPTNPRYVYAWMERIQPGGTFAMTGPASAVDNTLAVFNGTSGKSIKIPDTNIVAPETLDFSTSKGIRSYFIRLRNYADDSWVLFADFSVGEIPRIGPITTSPYLMIRPGSTQFSRFYASGSLTLGNVAEPSGGGAPVVALKQASGNPTGVTADTAGIFAKDVGGVCELFAINDAGAVTQLSGRREMLTAARSYYVRTDGSDSNNGLANTAGGAFLTIQKALDVASTLDFSTHDVTIYVGDGTRTEALLIRPWQGSGTLYLVGNEGTPANCVLSTTGGSCISVYGALPNTFFVRGFRLQTTTAGSCIVNTAGGAVTFRNIEFGATAHHHLNAAGGSSVINADGNYSIVGSPGLAHVDVSSGARVIVENRTVTLTGTPAWPLAFCHCWRVGIGLFYNTTFSGAATGTRYIVTTNGLIDTIGGGATALPGSVAGATASGGQYV